MKGLEQKNAENLNKWRLILGKNAANHIPFTEGDFWGGQSVSAYESMEDTLDYLYEMEYGDGLMRGGGNGNSQPYVADWIGNVRKLFPKKTVDVLEKQALEHFHLTELLTDKEVLAQMEPNMDLLKMILQFKHLMKSDVILEAKKIVAKIVEELTKQMETQLEKSMLGKLNRNMPSHVKSMRNFDIKKTIQKNLKHYDREKNQILLKDLVFSSRTREHNKYHMIIAVDESGSMTDSIIYSAVMAGIFAKLPMLRTKLIIFDTNIVDLSGYVDEPVEVLMGMQLGGGTNIGKALSYCEELCEEPQKTIVVVVTDLYEGESEFFLEKKCGDLIGSGCKVMFLTALDREANPAYDRAMGQKLADKGAFVGAMTPEQLCNYVKEMRL
ncbi:MAG: VWA domain-containing protein [Lachnospiraceae bacterium]|nr:VWA domain-containing protein [Lachnospiraceae bacterium]